MPSVVETMVNCVSYLARPEYFPMLAPPTRSS
jgi:hypothetical protein